MSLKENTPKAIFLIIIGMSVFALQDTLIKLISHETNIFLIYACRCLFGIIILIIFLLFIRKPIIIKTNYPFLTILRCFLFFLGFSLYYFSLSKLSLAVAVTLFFISPFFVTILSMLILKESIGIRRWGALFIGFVGVFLVMNPQIDNFNFYTLFPMICAFCYALTMIIQKKNIRKR